MTSVSTMAITRTAEPVSEPLTCAICRVNLPLAKSTAGLYDCNNKQAFACVSHFMEVEKLIIGWADFITAEIKKCLERSREPASLIYKEVGNARFDA